MAPPGQSSKREKAPAPAHRGRTYQVAKAAVRVLGGTSPGKGAYACSARAFDSYPPRAHRAIGCGKRVTRARRARDFESAPHEGPLSLARAPADANPRGRWRAWRSWRSAACARSRPTASRQSNSGDPSRALSLSPRALGALSFGRCVLAPSNPLTMIVGANGCGKTTIIECLKYSTTGEQDASSAHGARALLSPCARARSRRPAAAGLR